MCSVQEDGDLMPEARITRKSQQCRKCDQPAVVIIRINDAFCRKCFMSYSIHKFRMSFGKSKLIRDKEEVVLAFSGGNSSSAMLHLVQEGKSERAKRKLRFIPTLVHIDETLLVNEGENENLKESIQEVVQRMKDSGLPYSLFSISQVFDEHLIPIETNVTKPLEVHQELTNRTSGLSLGDQEQGATSGITNHNDDESRVETGIQPNVDSQKPVPETGTHSVSVQELLQTAKSLSAKENLVLNLRLHLLARITLLHGCNKVLLGDSGTRLAIRMLANITQGRGAHLSYEMSFADQRRDDVTMVRPMREFTSKEVAMYTALNKIEPVFIRNLSTKAAPSASLERLTEEFVTGLQADFPNTVSTIFRTGEKLDLSDRNENLEIQRCCMCQAPLDTDVPACSALSATLFSQHLCNKRLPAQNETASSNVLPDTSSPNATNSKGEHTHSGENNSGDKQKLTNDCNCIDDTKVKDECCGQGDGSCSKQNTRITLEQLNSTLCYGCRLVVKDMKNYEMLPKYILENAGKAVRRKQMKESIQDFLLDDE